MGENLSEKQTSARWFRFSIRDLFWTMAVVGLGIGWCLADLREHATRQREDVLRRKLNKAEREFEIASDWLADGGYEVMRSPEGIWIEHPTPSGTTTEDWPQARKD